MMTSEDIKRIREEEDQLRELFKERRVRRRNLYLGIGAIALTGIITCSIALSQELKGYPDLRNYRASVEFVQHSRGLYLDMEFDTDNDGFPDVVYRYHVGGNKGSRMFLTKPIGFFIDHNRDRRFTPDEFYDLGNASHNGKDSR